MNRNLLACAAAFCAGSLLIGARADLRPVRISARELMAGIETLTAPEMTGRGAGTPGLDRAAVWIEREFARAGLQPAFSGSWRQAFPITVDAALGSHNALVCGGCGTDELRLHTDYAPLPMSTAARVEGNLTFAGYGIDAPECGYSDYTGLDVRGRVVLIMKHEPQEYDSESVFEGRIYSEHSQILRKALVARDRGAAALLIVADSANHGGAASGLEAFTALPGPGSVGIPVVQVSPDIVARWFEAGGHDFGAAQRRIDESLQPQSFAFAPSIKARLVTDLTSRQIEAANVGAYLPGRTDEYVIAGAHYDHLGAGEQFSMAQDQSGTIHPGADDNASGTAAVVSLARWFSRQPQMRRGVLFLAFSGEELGLLGSTNYGHYPALPLANAVAMANLDMVGKLRENRLTIGGANSGTGLLKLLGQLGKEHHLELQMREDAVYGSSDHTVFRARGLPVLFFFTGLHADYHRPTDAADKIDGRSTARVAELAGSVVRALAEMPDRLLPILPKDKRKNTLAGQEMAR
ncbi:MAG TPA: M28 family peptidase [Bryobacteraceae bacterium]|nr:M28 family peptidase [Bryobacteraceae bacterium]